MSKLDDFERDIAYVLNRHGIDARCNAPDWLLAKEISVFLGAIMEVRNYGGEGDERRAVSGDVN